MCALELSPTLQLWSMYNLVRYGRLLAENVYQCTAIEPDKQELKTVCDTKAATDFNPFCTGMMNGAISLPPASQQETFTYEIRVYLCAVRCFRALLERQHPHQLCFVF